MEILKTFYEWEYWSGIMHNFLFVFTIYIIYLLIINIKERTLLNILLFTILIGIEITIHELINIRNNKITKYL